MLARPAAMRLMKDDGAYHGCVVTWEGRRLWQLPACSRDAAAQPVHSRRAASAWAPLMWTSPDQRSGLIRSPPPTLPASLNRHNRAILPNHKPGKPGGAQAGPPALHAMRDLLSVVLNDFGELAGRGEVAPHSTWCRRARPAGCGLRYCPAVTEQAVGASMALLSSSQLPPSAAACRRSSVPHPFCAPHAWLQATGI